jgi:hypothetical protein
MTLIAPGYHSAAGWQQQMLLLPLLLQAYPMQQQRQVPHQPETLQ